MAGETNSANMSLPVPGVGVTSGPQFALDINNCMTIIDAHNHSSGSGVQITPNGLDISTDLSIQSNGLTNAGKMTFSVQGSTLASSVVSAVYSTGADLYYNDSAGTPIQITKAGVVNATIGSLAGQSYAASTFIWKQGAGSVTPAYFDIGQVTIRPPVASTTNGITVSCPAGIASATNLVLPVPPPSGTVFVRMDNTGNQSALVEVDNSTLDIGSNLLRVKALGVTGAQIAANTIDSSKVTTTLVDGVTLAGGNNTPLYTTLVRLKLTTAIAINTQYSSGSTLYTVPAGCYFIGSIRIKIDAGTPFGEVLIDNDSTNVAATTTSLTDFTTAYTVFLVAGQYLKTNSPTANLTIILNGMEVKSTAAA